MIAIKQNNLSLFNITYVSGNNKTSAITRDRKKRDTSNIINDANNKVNEANNKVNDANNYINDANNKPAATVTETDPENIEQLGKLVENIYDVKKQKAIETAYKYKGIFNKTGEIYYRDKGDRIENCSSYLEFGKFKGKYRLINTNLCRVRLCPMCSYKRSLAVFRNTNEIIKYIAKTYMRPKYLFITLTVKNVKGDSLAQAIDHLNKAWANLVRQKALKNIIIGTIRTIEITYNQKTDTYHPHIHVMLHTSNDIYAGRNYISQARLTEMWRAAAGLDYDPVIDIRKVRGNNSKEIAEIAKYSVKPINWNEVPDAVLITLDDVLHKRHLITLAGSFREAKKAVKIDDIEDRQEWKEAAADPEAERIIYTWHFGRNKYISQQDADAAF